MDRFISTAGYSARASLRPTRIYYLRRAENMKMGRKPEKKNKGIRSRKNYLKGNERKAEPMSQSDSQGLLDFIASSQFFRKA